MPRGMQARSMARWVHPKAAPDPSAGQHDRGIDIASDAAPRHLRWIADLMVPYLGESTLEVGAGTGSITQHLAVGRRLLAADISDACLAALQARFADTPNVDVRRMDLRSSSLTETFDSTVLINVLEHIYDDAAALRALRDRLRPGGNCLIYVPALNWLYGSYDRDVGHYRRYSRPHLAAVVREAGMRAVHQRYVNCLAIPAWLLYSAGAVNRDDTESVGHSLGLWDRLGVPVTRAIEQRVRPPIGLNLFCVARRD